MESQKIKSPKTGRPITVGKGEYNKLLQEGYTVNDLNQHIIQQEKIKSPKTGRPITVGGVSYNKLIKEGYINTTKYETVLPEEALVNLILNTPPYDLISLYKTNKSYHQLLKTKYVLDLLYDRYHINKYNVLSFQDFIYSYMEKEMNSLNLKKQIYIENQIYTAFTIINDYWYIYELKVTGQYHLLSAMGMAIQYLENHGFKNEMTNVTEPYEKWLNHLKTKVYQLLLSKKGHYTLAPKREIKLYT